MSEIGKDPQTPDTEHEADMAGMRPLLGRPSRRPAPVVDGMSIA